MKIRTVLAPEIVKKSNGVACGDVLCIYAYRDSGRLFFSFTSDACIVASSVARLLEERYSGKDEMVIFNALNKFISLIFEDDDKDFRAYFFKRKSCAEAPVNLLLSVISENKNCAITVKPNISLACDACVENKSLMWDPAENKRTEDLFEVLKTIILNNRDKEEEILQGLGLCVLNDDQIVSFRNILSTINNSTFKKIKKLRLAVPLYNNSLKYNLPIDDKIRELAIKQIVSLEVANTEISKIQEFINIKELQIFSVKGSVSNSFYPKESYRTHMDFDYVANNLKDGFVLISYLINVMGFKLVVGGSVPFSIKSVRDKEGKERLLSHIHLEKILQDRFQVIVDINMGGFPLGRSSFIDNDEKGEFSLEDEVCVTISHLFKHEHAFVKDINDIYYFFKSNRIDFQLLKAKLKKFHLFFYFSVIMTILEKSMHLNNHYFHYRNISIIGWGFRNCIIKRRHHFLVKLVDLFCSNCRQFGLIKGVFESISHVKGDFGTIESSKYAMLCNNINIRTYLYPVVFFNTYKGLTPYKNLKMYDGIIGVYGDFVILPIGIFIMQNYKHKIDNRNGINSVVKNILNDIECKVEDLNFDFIMESRKETWLY